MLTVNSLPSDFVWASEYDTEAVANGDFAYDAIYVRRDFGQVDVAIPANVPLPCVREFGEHDCTGDGDCPAVETLYLMNAPMPDDYLTYDYPAYDPQTDHYERFGRPALPNEY